jgi:hypothetical protein
MQTTLRRAASALALSCFALTLTACGQQAGPPAGPGAGLPELPAPSSLPRLASYTDAERYLDAAQLGATLPHNAVAAEGSALRFSPDWDPAQDAHSVAFATYSWSLPGYHDPQQVGLEWAEAPPAGTVVWLAAADWTADRWVWHELGPGNKAGFSGIDFVKADGTIDAVVAVIGPGAAAQPLLNVVYVGSNTVVQPGDIKFTVDLAAAGTPISPLVYGTNEITTPGSLTAQPALVRFGGNRWTAYNWETNASNAGNDYFNQNDDYFGASDEPGLAVRDSVQASYNAGAQAVLVTMPILGYVAADKDGGDEFGSGDVINTPNYLNVRFHQSIAAKGAPFADPPNAADGFVYQDEFVNWLNGAFPGKLDAGPPQLMISLDNEPDLWADTHSRIQAVPLTYDALVAKNIEYAAAAKAVVPGALCFGAVNFGYSGEVNLQSAPDADAHPPDFITYYLAQLKAAEATHGNQRLLDVLDVHFYTEAEAGTTHTMQYAGSDDTAPDVVATRLQAPRSLWDDTYVENSWITRDYQPNTPVDMIHWLQTRIAGQYPGTKLAITEYNYGASDHISGGLAEADALGIFGREGLFAATYFALNDSGDPYVYGAMQLYRNYDGAGGRYGDQWQPVAWNDYAGYSAYAATYSTGSQLSLVLINKQSATKQALIQLDSGAQAYQTAQVYTLTAAGGPHPVQQTDLALGGAASFNADLPAMSATLLVLSE